MPRLPLSRSLSFSPSLSLPASSRPLRGREFRKADGTRGQAAFSVLFHENSHQGPIKLSLLNVFASGNVRARRQGDKGRDVRQFPTETEARVGFQRGEPEELIEPATTGFKETPMFYLKRATDRDFEYSRKTIRLTRTEEVIGRLVR